jgi:hypothetical protein
MVDHEDTTRSLSRNKTMRHVNSANHFDCDWIACSRSGPASRIFHRFVTVISGARALPFQSRVEIAFSWRVLLAFHFSLRFLDPKTVRTQPGIISRKASNSRKSAESRVKEARMFAFSVPVEGANYATTSSRLFWNNVTLSVKSMFRAGQNLVLTDIKAVCQTPIGRYSGYSVRNNCCI